VVMVLSSRSEVVATAEPSSCIGADDIAAGIDLAVDEDVAVNDDVAGSSGRPIVDNLTMVRESDSNTGRAGDKDQFSSEDDDETGAETCRTCGIGRGLLE
jgi:hypothetical protein